MDQVGGVVSGEVGLIIGIEQVSEEEEKKRNRNWSEIDAIVLHAPSGERK